MLRELSIENLAVIEKASIAFDDKLNVFTGETGAGKSILIGGINAILGGRVSKDIVRAGTEKAVVTGLFDDLPESVRTKLSDNGFAVDDELLLQRDIHADGKSTARINGRATTVAILRDIASELIDIHGQHDNRLLMDGDNQREILDSYGKNSGLLSEYATAFKEFSALSRKIKEVSRKKTESLEKAELLRERLEELDRYNFSADEEETVKQKIEELRNAEYISENLYNAQTAISGDDDTDGAYSMLEHCKYSVSSLSNTIPELDKLAERISDMLVELEDIREEIVQRIPDEDEDTAGMLGVLEERLSVILRLQRKYGTDLAQILENSEKWRNELYEIDNGDDIIEELTEKKKEAGEKVKRLATVLTNRRKKAADDLAKRISAELTFLDMPDIRLVFDISQDKVTLSGMDKVEMLISVNKGEDLKPMSKIASGGELSRIMLAVKNVLAETDKLHTMIFDEIDTGISGRAAAKVGLKLHEAAENRQILCVTHLAQIAAMADTQLLIKKTSDEKRTYTGITKLDFEGRKREIARIISGDENDPISLENAEMLLLRKNVI
ncbi:DNA repair protein RecN [[Eubacterium] siraeum DSM 15702]|uniref:DNA repair protein RecN n=3 Tax=root TaxID=1 RepID=B0MQ27_9FIRM|nr:DNA repair protein RecN [[Eubacterium] siraeum DSM 15702]UWP26234.1 DNA repair protein RecN [[Eubacterium] siraeum]